MSHKYRFSKYVTDSKHLRETIEKYGVAIIPSVLDEKECEAIVSGLWDYFEHITQDWETPIKRNDENTWSSIYKLYPLHSMLFQHFSCGHSQVAWDVRQNPKIVSIFAQFWECENDELLTSFDGLSFNIPPETTRRGWNRKNTWYHSDQSFTRNDFECIQSWVTGLDVEEGDATLSFMEGSNKYHEEFSRVFNVKEKSDWYKLNRDEEKFYKDKGCKYSNIKCPKGSIVFWDSRTIHCGIEASKTRENKKLRAIIYTCYQKRDNCDEKNLKKKIKAFEEMRTCNHWPCKIKMFPKVPRTYGGEVPKCRQIKAPVLSELGRKLAGY